MCFSEGAEITSTSIKKTKGADNGTAQLKTVTPESCLMFAKASMRYINIHTVFSYIHTHILVRLINICLISADRSNKKGVK